MKKAFCGKAFGENNMSKTAAFQFSWPVMLVIALCAYANPQAVNRALPRLLDHAIVENDSLTVADILPENAGIDLRSQAKSISLGAAPEPGAFRVFTFQELQDAIGGRAEVELPTEVTVRRRGWPVSPELVRSAALALGPSENWSDAEIVLPAELVTRSPVSALRVSQVRRGENPRTLMVRIECRERRDCAPFWAAMIFTKPVVTWHRLPAGPPTPPVSAALVTPGRPARLLCDGNGLRFSLRVLPLKRAGLGEVVKALDPRTRRMFLAEVEGPNLLRLHLQEAK